MSMHIELPQRQQLSLFSLSGPLPALVEPTEQRAPLRLSELSLRGDNEHCLRLLSPILRELSEKSCERWLTLIAPPSVISPSWLRETGLNQRHILLLNTRPHKDALQLALETLRLGHSHTVVSWLPELARNSRDKLQHAAIQGDSELLNIILS